MLLSQITFCRDLFSRINNLISTPLWYRGFPVKFTKFSSKAFLKHIYIFEKTAAFEKEWGNVDPKQRHDLKFKLMIEKNTSEDSNANPIE